MADRELNNLSYSKLRVDRDRLLSRGAIWRYQAELIFLPGGSRRVLSFTTGPKPVVATETEFAVASDNAVIDMHFYFAPTGVGEGTLVEGLPINHHKWEPEPLVEFRDGVVFFTEGVEIARRVFIGSAQAVSLNGYVFRPDSIYLLTIDNEPPNAPSFSGPWVYTTGNGAPDPGEAIYRANQDTLRVHHTDDDAGARQAELEGVEPGWFITNTAGGSWTVTAVAPGASDVSYTVTGGGSLTGRSDFTFSGPSPTPPDALMSLSVAFAAVPEELP